MNTTPFGQQLRSWRKRAGLSQVALAAIAQTTPRHLSFVETGRSRPGEEVVLRLGVALGLGMREQNELLRAAGLAPIYIEQSFEDEAMRPVRRVIDQILERHAPYPAWVMQGGLRFVQANATGHLLLPGIMGLTPPEIAELWFGPGPFREMVDNWEDVAHKLLLLLRREATKYPSEALDIALHRACEHMDGVHSTTSNDYPVICPVLNIGDQQIRTISSILRFETATSTATESLRVELMFPADEDGEAFFQEFATHAP